MSETFRVRVSKKGNQPGEVSFSDLARISQGLQDAVDRLVQFELGYSVRTRPDKEARSYGEVRLTGLTPGSCNLHARPVHDAGLGRAPASVAFGDVVDGIRHHAAGGAWPQYLPVTVRNRLGATLSPLFTTGMELELSLLSDNGVLASACLVDRTVIKSLIDPDVFRTDEEVQVVGNIIDIHRKRLAFKVEVGSRTVVVSIKDEDFHRVDELRWKRVSVTGVPLDPKCKNLRFVRMVQASTDDDDGIFRKAEESQVRSMAVFQRFVQRITAFKNLVLGWDSYQALPPSEAILEFACEFFADACGVLLAHDLPIPEPFVVPTTSGGIQFEWAEDSRELELEICSPGKFGFLMTAPNGILEEGRCGRWGAVRLMRWLASGGEL